MEPTPGPDDRRQPDPRPKRWPIVLAIIVGAAFLGLMIALHLSGMLGPGIH